MIPKCQGFHVCTFFFTAAFVQQSFKIRKTFISSKYIFLFSCNMTISWKKGFIRWRLCASWIFANLFWIACKLAMIADFKPDSLPLQYGSMSQMEHRKLDHWDKQCESCYQTYEITQGQNFNTSVTVLWNFLWTVRRIHGNSPEAISKLNRKTCFPFGNKGKTTSVTLSDQFT